MNCTNFLLGVAGCVGITPLSTVTPILSAFLTCLKSTAFRRIADQDIVGQLEQKNNLGMKLGLKPWHIKRATSSRICADISCRGVLVAYGDGEPLGGSLVVSRKIDLCEV